MAETVRIAPDAHAALAEMADALDLPQTEVLTRAIRELRTSLFFEQLAASHASASARAREEDKEDLAAWDETLADGVDE